MYYSLPLFTITDSIDSFLLKAWEFEEMLNGEKWQFFLWFFAVLYVFWSSKMSLHNKSC